jgi:hypothetical protein
MKTTFYCVNVEFCDNFDAEGNFLFHEVKACVTERQAAEKPNNQFREVCGLTAFKLWLVNGERAAELVKMVKSGEVYTDDLISFYDEFLSLEGRAA